MGAVVKRFCNKSPKKLVKTVTLCYKKAAIADLEIALAARAVAVMKISFLLRLFLDRFVPNLLRISTFNMLAFVVYEGVLEQLGKTRFGSR